MHHRSIAGVCGATLLGLAACATPRPSAQQPSAAAGPGGSAVGAATITPGDIHARVSFLASDALMGRDTPSPGLEAAAAYLVSEYMRLGLEPAGENGSYYQRFPFATWALDTASVHFGTLTGGKDNRMLAHGTDFFTAAAAGAEGAAMGHARLLFVGRLGEQGLPVGSYAGAAPMVSVPGDDSRDWRTEVARARRAAKAAGASALVVVLDAAFAPEQIRELAAQSTRVQRGILTPGELPVFYLSSRAAAAVAARGGIPEERLARPVEAPLELKGVEAHFAAVARTTGEAGAPNVAAVLRGSDPLLRDEYVILSSHMDHVGVGRPVNGDSIYNGADDDASGTAGLVEVAEALVSLRTRPRRSILFLHVSAEEKGLLGSRWYSDHPTVPIGQIVANVNVDMIGRNSPDTVVVIGKRYSSLGSVVEAAGRNNPHLRLVVADDPWPEERFFFRSDHFSFARKEIPALFFFTGPHEDYHQPSDEVDKLDVDKAARVARLIFFTAREIADDPRRPVWDPAGLAEVRTLTR